MITPPNSDNSYVGLLKRMTRRVQSAELDDQFVRLLQQTFETELEKENIVLSRPERVRLYRQIASKILNDALEKVGK